MSELSTSRDANEIELVMMVPASLAYHGEQSRQSSIKPSGGERSAQVLREVQGESMANLGVNYAFINNINGEVYVLLRDLFTWRIQT